MTKFFVTHEINDIDFDAWGKFVESNPHGNIFQSPDLFVVYRRIPNFVPSVIIVKEQDEIVGCLSSVIQKEGKGVVGFMTERSIVMGGPLARNNDLEIISLLLQEYLRNTEKNAIYSQFRNLFDVSFAKEVFKLYGFEYEKHLDILIDITPPIETIRLNVSKNKRGNISKSLNKGTSFFEVTEKESYIKCIDLVRKTYNRIGLPCPGHEYFFAFYDELHKKALLKIFALESENKLIGTRFELCYKDTLYDWWAGADDDYKNFYPNDVIPYQILIWGNQNGYKVFDFGGAGKPEVPYGVRDHKMKFGGELVEFGRFELVHKKALMQVGKIGLRLYKKIKKYAGSKG